MRLTEDSGRIGHAEIAIGDATLMLSDEFPEYGFAGATPALGGTFQIHLHVDNADAVIAKALAAGATVVREIADQFYGERSGTIRDPFGVQWNIGHHLEDVAPAEMQRRYVEFMRSMA